MEKKSNFSIRRLIYNDKYLIIVSFLLAIIIWIATSLNVGTAETKVIKMDVPIKLGDEISQQLGMQYYSLQDNIEISVTISGAKYVIGQVTPDDLSVTFDTSAVNRTGAQTIPILVNNSSRNLDFEVAGTYPSSIEGYFDVNASKVMNIELNYDSNSIADGYVFGEPVLSEDKIIVTGPKTYIDRLEKAQVNVVFDSNEPLTSIYKDTCDIEFIGSGIEHSYFNVTSRTDTKTPLKNISVTIPVLKQTNLPVGIDFVDRPAGLSDEDIIVRYNKTNVDAGVLDSADISSAIIGSVNFNELYLGSQKKTFDVTNLNGITILDDTKSIDATITIRGDYKRRSISVSPSNIIIEGAKDGTSPAVKSISSQVIYVYAPSDVKLNASNLTLKCDISEKKNSNSYPISISIDNDSSWVYGTYSATIE